MDTSKSQDDFICYGGAALSYAVALVLSLPEEPPSQETVTNIIEKFNDSVGTFNKAKPQSSYYYEATILHAQFLISISSLLRVSFNISGKKSEASELLADVYNSINDLPINSKVWGSSALQ